MAIKTSSKKIQPKKKTTKSKPSGHSMSRQEAGRLGALARWGSQPMRHRKTGTRKHAHNGMNHHQDRYLIAMHPESRSQHHHPHHPHMMEMNEHEYTHSHSHPSRSAHKSSHHGIESRWNNPYHYEEIDIDMDEEMLPMRNLRQAHQCPQCGHRY